MSARRSTGVILIASGSIGLFIGLVISASMVGAICGVPMILVCIVMIIWGYLMKAKDQAIRDESVSERMLQTQAIASGLTLCPQCKTPNQPSNSQCSNCGLEFYSTAGNQPTPISAIDPADAALRGKQVMRQMDPIIDDSEW